MKNCRVQLLFTDKDMVIKILTVSIILLTVTGCQNGRQPKVGPSIQAETREAGHSYIAFTALTGQYWQIWTISSDGGNLKQITNSKMDKRFPTWSADHGAIYYSSTNGQLYCMNVAANEEKQIYASPERYESLIESPGGVYHVLVHFDSQRLDDADLWITAAGELNLKILLKDKGYQNAPSWSSDGNQLVYVDSTGYRTEEVCQLDIQSRRRIQLTNNNRTDMLPSYSPNDSRIVFVSDRTGDYEIWIMNSDGGNDKQLTESPGLDSFPCWSPDGNKIAFISGRSGELALWIMNADGSGQKQVTHGMQCMYSSWQRTFGK